MVEPMLFEPEIEGLLREIAADPRSTLLRVDRPAVVRGLFDRGLPIRAHATGLTSAERHLLQVHRAELAFMLRQACVSKLYAHPEAKFRLIRNVAPGVRVEAPPPSHWRRNLGHELRIARADGIEFEGIELLQSCVAADGFARASVAQLAAASIRLEPTDQARIYSAVALMFDGDDRTAVDVFHRVIDATSSRRMQACAWTEIGDAANRQGRFGNAIICYRTAARLDADWAPAPLSLMSVGTVIANVEAIGRAAMVVERLFEVNPSGWREYIGQLRAKRAAQGHERAWVTREQVAQLERIVRTGRAGRALAHVLC
jgi:hypothetical protein